MQWVLEVIAAVVIAMYCVVRVTIVVAMTPVNVMIVRAGITII